MYHKKKTSLLKVSPPLRRISFWFGRSTCTWKNQILNIYDTNLSSWEQDPGLHFLGGRSVSTGWLRRFRRVHCSSTQDFCVAEHEMRQHSLHGFLWDFMDSYDHSAERRCYEIHQLSSSVFMQVLRTEWFQYLLIFPLLVVICTFSVALDRNRPILFLSIGTFRNRTLSSGRRRWFIAKKKGLSGVASCVGFRVKGSAVLVFIAVAGFRLPFHCPFH